MRLRIGPLPAWIFLLLLIVVATLAIWIPVQGLLIALTFVGLHAVAAANFGHTRHLPLWWSLCAVWALLGIGLAFVDSAARSSCLATYEGQKRTIGTELREEAQAYRQRNPALSNDELLFDAAGVAERVWTERSIAGCRMRLQWLPYFLPAAVLSFLASALVTLGIRRQGLLALPKRSSSTGSPADVLPVIYDCFISYRHQEPDRTFAVELANRLGENGLSVVIDERSFQPNQHFLGEMERCIRQSRFTLCVVTHDYLQSGACEEEATITKVLDMSDRKRRLVPLFVEQTEVPVWLYGLVGVNFFQRDPAVDPFEKLLALLAS